MERLRNAPTRAIHHEYKTGKVFAMWIRSVLKGISKDSSIKDGIKNGPGSSPGSATYLKQVNLLVFAQVNLACHPFRSIN